MKDKKIAELFYAICEMALDSGREISLELGTSETVDKVLNGGMKDYHSKSNGLTLRVFEPEPEYGVDPEEEVSKDESPEEEFNA